LPFAVLAILPFAVAAARKGWISQWLVVANVLVFAYMEILWMAAPASRLALDEIVVFRSDAPLSVGLIASMFVHADVLHLLGNMLVLYFIGVALEERVGTLRTGCVYVFAGILATAGYALFHWGDSFALVGASGAVSGLMGAMLVLYPRDEIPMVVGPIFLRRVPVWIAVGAFFGMEAILTILVFQGDNVAHAAHVIGLVAGMGLGLAVARGLGKKSKSASFERDKRLAQALARIATAPEAREAAETAAREEIPDVRRAWLDKALDTAKCPKCSGPLARKGDGAKCRQCGAEL
jgi:membrane associated rhomboid family serine protease